MKKIIVTGATGHIGSNLICELKKLSYKIKLLVLENENISHLNIDDQIEIARGNVLDKAFLEREIEQDSVVVHMAGIIDIAEQNLPLMFEVNVEGTKNIAEVSLEKKVEKFVFVSSVDMIPNNSDILEEPKEFDENAVSSFYAKTKVLAVKELNLLKEKGLKLSIVYPAVVVGKNDFKMSATSQLLLGIANKDFAVKMRGGYNFVDVEDVAKGIVSTILYGKNGDGYILAGEYITISEIYDTINSFMRRSTKLPKLPIWFLKMASPIAVWHLKQKKMLPIFSKKALDTIVERKNYSVSKAKSELNFEATDIKTTIIATLNWFYKNRKEVFKPKILKEIESKHIFDETSNAN